MTDLELEQKLVTCVRREREAVAEVLRYLHEVETRRLHIARGFSSLYAYCTEKLGYSEPEAQLRIQAMRLIRAVPEAAAKIEKGELSMSVAAQVQGAARREKLEASATKKLVEDLAGASKRQAEKALATLFPEAPKKETAKPISETKVEIRFTVSAEEATLFQKLLDRKSHANFDRSFRKLFTDLARRELEKVEKVKDTPKHGPGEVRSRHIPNPLRRLIWKRDRGHCQYVDLVSGRRCQASHGLQIDHIKRFADGGDHGPGNLRLLCGTHNRWRECG